MMHKMLFQQSNRLIVGVVFLLLSFAPIKSETEEEFLRGSLFDVRDKNIGFFVSPIPNDSTCFLSQGLIGSTTTIYRNSSIAPVVAVNPEDRHFVVAAWEQDVVSCCGFGLEIGIAYSTDSGKHWHQTVIPTQDCLGGFIQSSNSIWLSYGPNGVVYLVADVINASLDVNTLNQSGIIVSVSHDNGKTWSNPKFLAASQDFINDQTLSFPINSKPSITADPNIPGVAYAVWSNSSTPVSGHGDTILSITIDGGLTWSPHTIIYNPFDDALLESMSNGIFNNVSVTNNMIVVLPNNDILNFMTRIYAKPGATDEEFINDVWPYQFTLFDIAVLRSTDGGITWPTEAIQITTMDGNATFTNGYTYDSEGVITGGIGAQTSTEGSNQFFNVNMNPANGNLYVVWQSGQFTENQLPQIALSTSRDGGFSWSAPVMVSRTPLDAPNPQAFTPAVAITKQGNLGLLYYDFRKDSNLNQENTKTNVWLAEYDETLDPNGGSTGIGLNFVTEVRISKKSYIIQNGPMVGTQFITNGNYNQVVAHGKDDFYAVYVKANNGPFVPPITLVDDVETETILLLDNNKRTAPYFSKVDAK